MQKDGKSISHIFVKKITEKWQKLFTKEELLKIWLRSGWSETRFSYGISLLLGGEMLFRVARDVYMRTGESLDVHYWDIVKKLIAIHAPAGAIVWWEKSLEIHMMNYSVPEILILYTRTIALRIRLSDGREVHFRVLTSGDKMYRKNMYPILAKYSSVHPWIASLCVLDRELALLEALSLREHERGVTELLVFRFLSREQGNLRETVFEEVARYRYIRALNRLRVIARDHGYVDLYSVILGVIKHEWGGCFINIAF